MCVLIILSCESVIVKPSVKLQTRQTPLYSFNFLYCYCYLCYKYFKKKFNTNMQRRTDWALPARANEPSKSYVLSKLVITQLIITVLKTVT